jgi:predicted nucleic acid-binding protein
MTAAPLPLTLPDEDDRMWLEVAVAGRAEALVTGNLKHFPVSQRHGIRVVHPSAFLLAWSHGHRS